MNFQVLHPETLIALTSPLLLWLGPTLADSDRAAIVVYGGSEPAEVAPLAPAPSPARVDLALCLDTSGSMSGLIESAKQKLWAMVNELALAQPAPELRVSLITFGNDGHDPQRGWVQVASPLTQDLDKISELLFALSTNGGTEYVGRAVHTATHELAWADDPNALKLIVVAGNESADQDVEVRSLGAASAAIAKGIQVNALYCGALEASDASSWSAVSRRADGLFAAIDHNTIHVIETPFDAELASMSASLNETYIPIGVAGHSAWLNQSEQDANAAALNTEAAASRANSKSTALYWNSWDVVDNIQAGSMKLEEIPKEDLPEELRTLSDEELVQHVESKLAQRVELQESILAKNAEREEWIRLERQREGVGENTFDEVLRGQIRQQAEAKGYSFPAATSPVEGPGESPGEGPVESPVEGGAPLEASGRPLPTAGGSSLAPTPEGPNQARVTGPVSQVQRAAPEQAPAAQGGN